MKSKRQVCLGAMKWSSVFGNRRFKWLYNHVCDHPESTEAEKVLRVVLQTSRLEKITSNSDIHYFTSLIQGYAFNRAYTIDDVCTFIDRGVTNTTDSRLLFVIPMLFVKAIPDDSLVYRGHINRRPTFDWALSFTRRTLLESTDNLVLLEAMISIIYYCAMHFREPYAYFTDIEVATLCDLVPKSKWQLLELQHRALLLSWNS